MIGGDVTITCAVIVVNIDIGNTLLVTVTGAPQEVGTLISTVTRLPLVNADVVNTGPPDPALIPLTCH